MVKILFVVIATLASTIIAAPHNITSDIPFRFVHRGLDAHSSSICVDCASLCNSTSTIHSGKACRDVCAENQNDKSECLNKGQRKALALALYPNDAANINGLDKHEIKDYLFEHLDRSIFADTKRTQSVRRGKICVNCKEVCNAAYSGHGLPGDANVCAGVCAGEEDDECEHMNLKQQNMYMTAYNGPHWKNHSWLVKAWQKKGGNNPFPPRR